MGEVLVPTLTLGVTEVSEVTLRAVHGDGDEGDDDCDDEAKRTSGYTISMCSALATASAAEGTTARNCSSLGHCSSVAR